MNLKLYVWEEFDAECHFGGLAFAIAESPERAKEIISAKMYMPPSDDRWGSYTVVPLTEEYGKVSCGGD
jgi:hypothetical protein